MTIGNVRGKAVASGGAGGSFNRDSLAWLAQKGTLYGDPGLAPVGGGSSGEPEGLEASGGYVADWVSSPGDVYRTHIFTQSGSFEVSAAGSHGNNLEFLVVAGGGGGGLSGGGGNGGRGGGGAGGLRTNAAPAYPNNLPSTALVYPGSGTWTCPVTIGAGGNQGLNQNGFDGGNSSITNPSPNPSIIATGGGGGSQNPGSNGNPGGSGGGGAYTPSTAGSTVASPDGVSPTAQGYGGEPGSSTGDNGGGGGGGAGGVAPGINSTHAGGAGGVGVSVAIAGPPSAHPIGAEGPDGAKCWFAGGGAGAGGYPGGAKPGGPGGSGDGSYPYSPGAPMCGGGNGALNSFAGPNQDAEAGYANTGGGGGGGCGDTIDSGMNGRAGKGGSGIVAIKYKIGTTAPTAKATGGAITLDTSGGLGNERWVHTFTKTDSFTTTEAIPSAEYLVIAGGGGGGGAAPFNTTEGGGGGAGGFKTNQPGNPYAPHGSAIAFAASTSYTMTVGAGGVGKTGFGPNATSSTAGGDSTLTHSTGSFSANGGGHGAGDPPSASDLGGGSGGGGGGDIPAAGTADANQGNPGGAQGPAGSSSYYAGGGGGGAGGAGGAGGSPGSDHHCGPGGDGIASTIDGTSRLYAGGGSGGGHDSPATPPSPGGGGIGANGSNSYATSGLSATGSGGGGGTTPDMSTAGSGGSGIIVIAYPK